MPLGVPSFPWGDMFSSHGKYPNWIIVAKNILEHLQCQRVSSVTVRRFRNPYLPRPSKIGGTHMYILHWLELIQWSTRPINWNKTKRNDKTAWNEQETSNGGSPRNLVEHTINQWTAERTRAKHTRLDNLYGMWVAYLLSRTRSWPWCKTWRNTNPVPYIEQVGSFGQSQNVTGRIMATTANCDRPWQKLLSI